MINKNCRKHPKKIKSQSRSEDIANVNLDLGADRITMPFIKKEKYASAIRLFKEPNVKK